MGALVLAAFILVYLGRILALVWGVKPLEPGDVIFLLPIPLLVLALWWQEARRRRLGRRYAVSVPAPLDGHDWLTDDGSGDKGRPEPDGAMPSAEEEERLREQQEWATARYHWWKQ